MINNFTKAYFKLINNDLGLTLPVIAYYSYLRDKFETFQRLQNAEEVFVVRDNVINELGISVPTQLRYEKTLVQNHLIAGKYKTISGKTHFYFTITECNDITKCNGNGITNSNDNITSCNDVITECNDAITSCNVMQTSIRQTTLDRQYEADVLTPEQVLIVTGSDSYKIARKHISGLTPNTYLHYKTQVTN